MYKVNIMNDLNKFFVGFSAFVYLWQRKKTHYTSCWNTTIKTMSESKYFFKPLNYLIDD